MLAECYRYKSQKMSNLIENQRTVEGYQQFNTCVLMYIKKEVKMFTHVHDRLWTKPCSAWR